MLKALILEDEKAAQELLSNYLCKVPFLSCIGIFETGLDIPKDTLAQADLLFLDIQLPEINGLSYVKTLTKVPKIIITSAFPDYAIDAFEIAVVDYLLKPFDFERFLKAVARVKDSYEFKQNQEHFQYIYADKTLHKIKTADILYIKAEVDYVKVVSKDHKLLALDSLKNWAEKLERFGFVQCHRSYVVNVKAVKNISKSRLTVINEELPVSASYKTALFTLFKNVD